MRGRLVGLAAGLALGATGAGAQVAQGPFVETAARFVGHIMDERFAEGAGMVAPVVSAALDEGRLRTVRTQLIAAAGPLRMLTPLRDSIQADGSHTIEFDARFERQAAIVRVVLDGERRVTGLWFLPPAPPPAREPPYADAALYSERAITVGEAPWTLPGTLTMPAGEDAVPAVVLVHGSGPHDRDETVGPNRPFLDLAHGLASNGVAVLRYEKRTKTHGARMDPDITVEQEVILDALAALEVARAQARVDRVYVLGHSLGGQLAPIIAQRADGVAGAILLAAPARPLADILAEQLTYIDSITPDSATSARLRALIDSAAMIRNRTLPPGAMVMGATAGYMYDLDDRNALGVAKELEAPLLVLQGGRDYQVTREDYELWRAALEGRRASFREYPELNHLFMEGQGKATPQEYLAVRGHVAERVIFDIARWVRDGRLD